METPFVGILIPNTVVREEVIEPKSKRNASPNHCVGRPGANKLDEGAIGQGKIVHFDRLGEICGWAAMGGI